MVFTWPCDPIKHERGESHAQPKMFPVCRLWSAVCNWHPQNSNWNWLGSITRREGNRCVRVNLSRIQGISINLNLGYDFIYWLFYWPTRTRWRWWCWRGGQYKTIKITLVSRRVRRTEDASIKPEFDELWTWGERTRRIRRLGDWGTADLRAAEESDCVQ